MIFEGRDPNGNPITIELTADGKLKVDLQALTLGAVEITNDEGNAIPVSATQLGALDETPPATDTAAAAVNGRLQRLAQRVTSLIGLVGEAQDAPTSYTLLARLKTLATLLNGGLPASLGAKTAAESLPVTLSTDGAFAVNFGAKADAVANDDSGSYSHIALLKRVSARITSVIALLPTALTSNGGLKAGLVEALPAGTNVVGKTGYKLVKVLTSFQRPNDTTAYSIGDAVTNSTSSPTVFSLDLGALGAVAGQAIEVRKLAVVSNVKQPTLPLFNVYLSAVTFTATNDNAALSIDDTTMETGGAWLNCDVQNSTAENSRVAYIGVPQPMVLAAADTKLYGEIQAANAYGGGAQEKYTILAWVALL